MNLNVTAAIAWRIAQELCRRPRPPLQLSVNLQRLNNGQNPCVSIMRREDWTSLVEMNLAGTDIVVHPVGPPRARMEDLDWRPPEHSYLAQALDLGIEHVVDGIEALLGLPPWRGKRPATTPPMLAIRLIAAVMQRLIFHHEAIWAEPGYHFDDDRTARIEDWVADLADIGGAALERARAGDSAGAARKACRMWRLSRGGQGGRAVLLDLGTAEARTLGNQPERLSLARWYQTNGHRVAPLADWVVAQLVG